jgi:hypothetical protein
MEPEILKADRAFRARLFLGYGLSLAALAALVPAVSWAFARYMAGAQVPQKLLAAEAAGSGFMLLFILPSVYLVATGRRVVREGRWPHSGMKVIHDTEVQRGAKAVARGRRLIWLGATCIFLVVCGSLATRFIFYKFKTDPLFFAPKSGLQAKAVSENPLLLRPAAEPKGCVVGPSNPSAYLLGTLSGFSEPAA